MRVLLVEDDGMIAQGCRPPCGRVTMPSIGWPTGRARMRHCKTRCSTWCFWISDCRSATASMSCARHRRAEDRRS